MQLRMNEWMHPIRPIDRLPILVTIFTPAPQQPSIAKWCFYLTHCKVDSQMRCVSWCAVQICEKGYSRERAKKTSPPSAATLLSHAGQTWMGSRQCIQTGRSALLGRTQTWCGPFFAPSLWLWRPVSGRRCPGSSLPSVSVGVQSSHILSHGYPQGSAAQI